MAWTSSQQKWGMGYLSSQRQPTTRLPPIATSAHEPQAE
jgi:hypothetical protein